MMGLATMSRLVLSAGGRSPRIALRDPFAAQERLERELLRSARGSAWSEARSGSGLKSIRDLAPQTYADYAPWIERIAAGQRDVLTADPVLFLEKTSGSCGPRKCIPYTRPLKRSFSRMFALWAADLVRDDPELLRGRIFMAVSPRLDRETHTRGGVPVGMDTDADYIGGITQRIADRFLVRTPGVGGDEHDFMLRLARVLLAAEDLRTISIWSPSFLLSLLRTIQADPEQATAGLNLPPERASVLRSELRSSAPQWGLVWPGLRLISMWASGEAAPLAARVRTAFPGVRTQPKGLLATEAPITVPLVDAQGFVPLPAEVLYEFVAPDGSSHSLGEVDVGQEYTLRLSQRSGLLRYGVGDRVRVTHRYGAVPCFDFLGRADRSVDMVGEKLAADYVGKVLLSVGLDASSACLVPVREGDRCRYVLLTERPSKGPPMVAEIEAALCRWHHYAHARTLGQLHPVAVQTVTDLDAELTALWTKDGRRAGDRKPSSLWPAPVDGLGLRGGLPLAARCDGHG